MLIVLAIYAALIWLIFFQFKLLPWSKVTKGLVALVGLVIVLVVIGMLNTKTPSGRVTAMGQVVEIAPVVSGVVDTVSVKANDPVEEGSELFRLDQRSYQYTLDQAVAREEIAKITYDRKAKLAEGQSATISQQELDEAQAQLVQAVAARESAEYNLEQTVVRAPSDGIVTALRLAPGEQTSAMSPVIPFIRAGSPLLVGVFGQNGAAAISPGVEVRIVFYGDPGSIYKTTVTSIVPGTSSGQFQVSGALAGGSDIGASTDLLVTIAWPENVPSSLKGLGMTGSATVFGPDAGAMGLLATVLLYIKMLGTYL